VENTFIDMDSIFKRTKNALMEFMEILTPIIENAQDDHERLFWHHIYEEEEHRSDRLDILMPKITAVLKNEMALSNNQPEFVHLLQDISLEKFGLHNFLEHLDLFLFQYKETEFGEKIQALRSLTNEDYQQMKVSLEKLNSEFQGGIEFNTSIPTDEKEENGANVKVDAYSQYHSPKHPQANKIARKSLTVGSLKHS